jgi:O-antigen/teichoic acid export membrane protein
MWIYAFSLAVDKAFSVITIPLMASYVAPGEYGDYELVLSLCAFVLLVLGFGVADTFMRFGGAQSELGQRRYAAELLGVLLIISFTLGLLIQLGAQSAADLLGIKTSTWSLRWTLLASTVTGLIELPLVWVRMRDRPGLYLWLTVPRAIAHVAATWTALVMGYGVEGVIVFNAWIGLACSAVFVTEMARTTGIAFSKKALLHLLTYGLPIVGGGLAYFVMTTLNRWFLTGVVTHEEIGLFGLANRIAMAASLAIVPVVMWWFPKRIAALGDLAGRQQSVLVWGYAIGLILLSSLAIILLSPIFVAWFFPKSYAGALQYLPGCIVGLALGQIVSFTCVGVMARDNGYWSLGIDCVAALAAFGLLFILIPRWGVHGAIWCTIAAHVIRLALFYLLGQKTVSLEYPIGGATIVTAVCVFSIWFAPDDSARWSRFAWSVASLATVTFLLHALHVARIPQTISQGANRLVNLAFGSR